MFVFNVSDEQLLIKMNTSFMIWSLKWSEFIEKIMIVKCWDNNDENSSV